MNEGAASPDTVSVINDFPWIKYPLRVTVVSPPAIGHLPVNPGSGLDLLAMINSYQAEIMPLAKDMGRHKDDLMHMAAGLSGESGELLDCIKKTWCYDKPLDLDNVLEECGDALFYLFGMLRLTGLTLEQALEYNYRKLKARYGTSYSDAAAQARADKQE